METVIEQIKAVPEYLKTEFTVHTLIAVVVLAVFLFVLFFSNKVAGILRNIFVIACILAIIFAYFTQRYPMIWTAVFSLIILAIIRGILKLIRTRRQDKINARIEERALAKAEKRRGSWKNKQGYSGEAKPIIEDYTPGTMDEDEIKDLVENESADASHKEYQAKTEAVQASAPTPESNSSGASAPTSADSTKSV